MRKVVIAAGGTGGHFYPGLVLARTLKERGWQPLILLRQNDAGRRTLEAEGLPSVEVDLEGMPRGLSRRWPVFFWKLAKSLLLVSRVLRDFGPDAVVGMGGYLSFPCILGAARRGLPRAVHESNAALGLANSLCVRLGAKLFWGLPPLRPAAGTLTGTPIRPALWEPRAAAEARSRLELDAAGTTVLVFGGSQGARGINAQVPGILAGLGAQGAGALQVLHLAGEKDREQVAEAYRRGGLKARVLAYLEEMDLAYAAADVVVCRSGASTLAELCAQGKPAVLIPFPHAAAGHQEENARVLERAGAARVVLERDLGGRLSAALADLLSSEGGPPARRALGEALGRLGLPPPRETAERLADAVEALARPNETSDPGRQ